MKRYFALLLLFTQTAYSQNPLLAIKDKAQLMPGVTINQAPDYSLLKHFKAFSNNNIYLLKKDYAIKGADYVFDTTYITIQNSRVLDILFLIKGAKEYNSIKRDLEAIYPLNQRVNNTMNIVYVGDPVTFSLQSKYLFVRYANVDTLTPPRDETGLSKLPGLKFSNPLIQEYLSKLGSDYKINVSDAPTKGSYRLRYEWKDKGIEFLFYQSSFKNDNSEITIDTVLISIVLSFILDKKNKNHKGKSPYSGPLPFNSDPNSNYYQVIDKFGKPDNWMPYLYYGADYQKNLGIYFSFENDANRKTEELKIKEIRMYRPSNSYKY